ncbi:hypothetical protein CWE15_08155 [Aliidiomarina taiwanensis]|uniref:DUF3014 domain-containing protein n=1 Tax=Aliidiomarina taiwanensis TaxID=946228 RepID=A0A432X1H1_9GAMM|nr:DUF3014 domain-containing protein [Aliidiomarina taiwanensis]RUO40108.1 hypothetical protein CWE15_08155 [Aliidiomarina taiwanensis]
MREDNQNDVNVSPAATNTNTKVIVGICVVVAIVIIGWAVFSGGEPEPQPEPIPVAVEETQPPVEMPLPEEPAIAEEVLPELDIVEEPEPEMVVTPALPQLANSTPVVMTELNTRRVNTRAIHSDNLVRDFVAFVDNLAVGEIARESAVIKGPEARFAVQEVDGNLYLDPQSYERYNPIVDWFVNMDNQALITVFEEYEPLFDEAFAEISRPDASFRERLQQAAQVLLDTPAQRGMLELKQEKVMYTFADESLESLPAAQKQMLRLGPDNMARVKRKINSLLQAL